MYMYMYITHAKERKKELTACTMSCIYLNSNKMAVVQLRSVVQQLDYYSGGIIHHMLCKSCPRMTQWNYCCLSFCPPFPSDPQAALCPPQDCLSLSQIPRTLISQGRGEAPAVLSCLLSVVPRALVDVLPPATATFMLYM